MKCKPFEIPESLVWEAWKYVKRAKGGSGLDLQTIETYENELFADF